MMKILSDSLSDHLIALYRTFTDEEDRPEPEAVAEIRELCGGAACQQAAADLRRARNADPKGLAEIILRHVHWVEAESDAERSQGVSDWLDAHIAMLETPDGRPIIPLGKPVRTLLPAASTFPDQGTAERVIATIVRERQPDVVRFLNDDTRIAAAFDLTFDQPVGRGLSNWQRHAEGKPEDKSLRDWSAARVILRKPPEGSFIIWTAYPILEAVV